MFPCELKDQPPQPTLVIRLRTPAQHVPHHLGQAYSSIMQYLCEQGEDTAIAAFAAYYNMDMQDLDMEAGFTLKRPLPGRDEIQSGEIPEAMMAVCHYTGPYEGVGTAYETLTRFAMKQGYMPSGVAYEFYLNGPETPPQDLKTDVVFPVVRTGARAAV